MVSGSGSMPCVKCGQSTGRDSQITGRDFYCDKCWTEKQGKKIQTCPMCLGKGFITKEV